MRVLVLLILNLPSHSVPFLSFSSFCCLLLELSTVFTLAPHPLVFADAAAATFYTHAPLPLVLADAAADAGFTVDPHSLVLADSAATTGFTLAPHLLVLAEAADVTLFTPAPQPLVLASAAAATLFTLASRPLVLAEAAAATLFTRAPHPLVPNARGFHRTTQFLCRSTSIQLIEKASSYHHQKESAKRVSSREIRTLPNGVGRVD